MRQKNIAIHQEKINDFEKKKEELSEELGGIKELIAKAEGRIAELQRIIDSVIIPTKEYVLYASEYMQGWITFINQKIFAPQSEKDPLIESCMAIYHGNLRKVGAKEDSQNSVYLSVL